MPTTTPTRKPSIRINRSISFPANLHAYVTQKASKERRSFNWIVNDLIQRELQKAR